MTIRNFWIAFATYVSFFAIMVLCAFTFGQVSIAMSNRFSEEELFLRDVMKITPMEQAPFFALMPQPEYTDFTELVQSGQPNLVIHATITERKPCTVFDPFGFYNNKSLNIILPGEEKPKAEFYICTPYQVTINEVLLGDKTLFGEGDTFTFYAPYGMVDNYAVRYEDCPLFTVNRDYILFFSVLDITGVGRWFDLTHPSSALEIMLEDSNTLLSMTENGYALYEETHFDIEYLYRTLAKRYEEKPYPLDIPTITPMNPAK